MPPKTPKGTYKTLNQKSSQSPQISIQSFYKREGPPVLSASPSIPGNGFTEEELADAADPLHRNWDPEREYEEFAIDQLMPGPKAVTFAGRIVNMMTVIGGSKSQPKAAGWHYLIVKDDSGAITVKIFFASKPYPLLLGHLISCWTAFVSEASTTGRNAAPSDVVRISANMFPGRVTSDHVMIHTSPGVAAICHKPLGYVKGQPLQGLMALESYLKGGHDGVSGIRLLVCVKSRGASKKITLKQGDGTRESELMEVVLMDHTAECRMTVWNSLIESARLWEPGGTMLLLSNPGFKVGGRAGEQGTVAVLRHSLVDVDPESADVEWLRKWVEGKIKKEAVVLEFPENVWDVEAVESGLIRMLFTLAELDTWVRSDSHQTFAGYVSVTIMGVKLATTHRRGMLFCGSCCGNALYSSTSIPTTCNICFKSQTLLLNPQILGSLLDETGCIPGHKLLWSTRAWELLFGRSMEEVAAMTINEVRLFEQRLLFMRVHLCVGWNGEEVGRLAVLGVKM